MPVGFADGAVDAGGLDLVGDLRRVVGWPARAGSVWRAVQWPAGAAGSGAAVVAGLVGVLARYTGQSEVVLGLASGGVV
ncbi:hypothetical protein AB0B88_25090, partial [Micromonospora haikouensis]|uniref:hypothetical protein n=1 Tax=Micromonospora haikouensis TaxID=686309 RepID=UPI00348F7401